jgi:hypothetical protein
LNFNPRDAKNEDLEFTLNQFLEELKEKSIMHDDTTIGVIISERTIDYHQAEFESKSELTIDDEENTNQ